MGTRGIRGWREALGALVALAVLPAATSAQSPAATTPEAPVPSSLVTTSIAHYALGAQLSARRNVVAIAQVGRNPRHATLLIGRGNKVPVRAARVGRLPIWAQPHVGTDAKGRPVVTYPRCRSSRVASCDLFRYDVRSRTEAPMGSISRAGVGEVEAVMDRGSVAFSRWTGTAVPRAMGQEIEVSEPTRLFYRRVGERPRRLADSGGRMLALRGPWIAQIRDTTGRSAQAIPRSGNGDCGNSTVELISTDGEPRKVVWVKSCDGNGAPLTGPAFIDRTLVFGEAPATDPGADRRTLILRYGLDTGSTTSAPGGMLQSDFVATGPDRGYGIRLPEVSPGYGLKAVSGIPRGTPVPGEAPLSQP